MKEKLKKRPLWKRIIVDHYREIAEVALVVTLAAVVRSNKKLRTKTAHISGELDNQRTLNHGLTRRGENLAYQNGKLAEQVQCKK